MIPTNHGPMTPMQIIDRLRFVNYAHNRDLAPHISVERWREVFGADTDMFEAQYQAEKAIAKAAA